MGYDPDFKPVLQAVGDPSPNAESLFAQAEPCRPRRGETFLAERSERGGVDIKPGILRQVGQGLYIP